MVSNPTQATQGNEAGANTNNQGQPGNPNQAPQGTQIPLGGGIPIPTLAADPPIPRSRGINRIQDLPDGEYVEFNQFGQAVGKWQNLYGKYMGTRTRRLISILKKTWKHVTKEEKKFLWSDIKAHFRLENDDFKKQTLVSCGNKWKAFKTKLRVKYMLKGISPLGKWTFIEPHIWEEFCHNEDTPEKNKLRAQASERGKKHINRPRLGSKGYCGFEKQWQEERNDPEKATELHLIPDIRGSNYCLARAPRDKNGIKTLPPELIDVSKNLIQATKKLSQGSDESKARVDPLILVLGPEHGGRTRGVGCDVGYKKGIEGYVRKKRTYQQREDIEEIKNQVRQEIKEELNSSEFWQEMRLELKAELRKEMQVERNEAFLPSQDDVRRLGHGKNNVSSSTNIVKAACIKDVRKDMQAEHNEGFSPRQDGFLSSCHRRSNVSSTTSIVKLDCIKEEAFCCLYVPSSVLTGERVTCATATVFPIGNNLIHGKNILKGHMKVSVIKVVEIHKSMELPVPDDEIPNLEFAVNGFIQWPINAIARFKGSSKAPVSRVSTKRVLPQHKKQPSTTHVNVKETLKEPNKKDKSGEETIKNKSAPDRIAELAKQKEQAEKERAENRKKLMDLEHDIQLNKPKSVLDGYNRWMSRGGDCAEPYAIRVDKEVFRQVDESYFAINATDIVELLTNQELECGILTLFEMSLYHLKGRSKMNRVGFLNPGLITADACLFENWATLDYLTRALEGYDFYLAPYLQGRHYVLFIICPKHEVAFILNSSKGSSKDEETYRLAGLVESVVGGLRWEFPDVNRQPSEWECGFYVMKWMHDFVLKYQNDNFPNIVPWSDERPLENKELNAIIGAWFTLWRD